MGRSRPSVLDHIEDIVRDDSNLAATLGRAEIAARIVAREVGIALRHGVRPGALRDFAERAFAEILASSPGVRSVRDGAGTLLGTGLGRTHDVFVDAVRETAGAAPRTEVRVLRGGTDPAVAEIVHGETALLVLATAAGVRVFVEDPCGGPFVAPGPAAPSGAPLIPIPGGAMISAA